MTGVASGPHSANWLANQPSVPEASGFAVSLRRQFAFEDALGEYAGMNARTVVIECDAVPDSELPRDQRWGYAGPRRADVDDERHPEIVGWAGHIDSWKRAAEESDSFKALGEFPPIRWRVFQGDM